LFERRCRFFGGDRLSRAKRLRRLVCAPKPAVTAWARAWRPDVWRASGCAGGRAGLAGCWWCGRCSTRRLLPPKKTSPTQGSGALCYACLSGRRPPFRGGCGRGGINPTPLLAMRRDRLRETRAGVARIRNPPSRTKRPTDRIGRARAVRARPSPLSRLGRVGGRALGWHADPVRGKSAVQGVEGVDAPHPLVSLLDAAGGVCARAAWMRAGLVKKKTPRAGGVVGWVSLYTNRWGLRQVFWRSRSPLVLELPWRDLWHTARRARRRFRCRGAPSGPRRAV